MKTRRVPTEIFITKAENYGLIQFFGQASEFPTDDNTKLHQAVLKALGEKYNFNWQEVEITPQGEVIQIIKEEDKV